MKGLNFQHNLEEKKFLSDILKLNIFLKKTLYAYKGFLLPQGKEGIALMRIPACLWDTKYPFLLHPKTINKKRMRVVVEVRFREIHLLLEGIFDIKPLISEKGFVKGTFEVRPPHCSCRKMLKI